MTHQAGIRHAALRGWPDFIEAISPAESHSPVDHPYFFRGQPSDWPLRPSLTRHALSCGLDIAKTLAIEKATLKEFKLHAHLYLPAAFMSEAKDYLGWWGLMQHHGVPTRLLDWTASPYVAAYFASADCPARPGVVWMVHVTSILDAMKLLYPQSYVYPEAGPAADKAFMELLPDPVLYFLELDLHTERMAAQQTRFSVSYDVLGDHGQIIESASAHGLTGAPHRRLLISPELKSDFLRRLRPMNITARTLFPGVDGFGRSVKELVRLCADYERKG